MRVDDRPVDINDRGSFGCEGAAECISEGADVARALVTQADACGDETKIGCEQLAVSAAALMLHLLNVLQEAWPIVFHSLINPWAGIFNCHGGLADVELRATAAMKGDRHDCWRGEGRANRHSYSLTNAAPESMHAQMRSSKTHIPVAIGGIILGSFRALREALRHGHGL